MCRNYKQGKCDYSEDMCWWNHSEKEFELHDKIQCFICNKIFDNRTDMMKHRKKEHVEMIKTCRQYQSNNCRYVSESCWFKHENDEELRRHHETKHEGDQMETESVFRKVSENLEPPLLKK